MSKSDFLGFGQALAEQRRVGFRVRHGYGHTAQAPGIGDVFKGVGIPGDQPTAINELPNYANTACDVVRGYGYQNPTAKLAVRDLQMDYELATGSPFPGGVDGVWGPGCVKIATALATVDVPPAYFTGTNVTPAPVAPAPAAPLATTTTTAMPLQTKILVAASLFGLGIIGYTMFKGYKPGRRRAHA